MRLTTLAAALMPFALHAQITIGLPDMPSAGDTVRYRTVPATGLDAESTEAGFIWDFTLLPEGTEGADTCVTVASTPLPYQFYFNNPFLYPDHRADYAVRGQGFNFQVLTVSDVREYFKKDATGFRNVGFGANINGIPSSTRRIPVDWIHRFPLEYGDLDTSFSEFTLSVPTLFSYTQRQTRYNEVDGWGTLYLPADTFEVLRVKSTLARIDSAYVEQFGQGFTFPETQTIEYKWIAQGMDLPVLVITVVAGQPTTARYHYSPVDVQTGLHAAEKPRMLLFPNPAEHSVDLRFPEGDWRTVRVLDSSGRMMREMPLNGAARLTINLAGLAPGAYAVDASGPDGRLSARLLVQ
ncbi:MAG TPA: hypothetical protein PKY96_00390 [Flavobacteriales bacterium]|nr:hypothetical protein [Flavobacteriales bacterium]